METHDFLAFFSAWICLSVSMEFCIAVDSSIRMNQSISISEGETLVSSDQSFELGFYSPGTSKNWYLGIWYKSTPPAIVWVANRNSPITDSYGVLTIINNGGLVLLNRTRSVVWSSDLSTVPENPVAQLLENGNLVLWDNSSESSKSYIWQSFDHPSDTLLPGMRMGWNLKSGLQRNLTSWRNFDDPSPGDFSYRIDINELPYMVIDAGSKIKLRSGPWNGNEFIGLQVLDNQVYKAVAFDKDEVYALYEPSSNEAITRLTLNSSGFLQHLVYDKKRSEWDELFSIPNDLCENYRQCGSNGVCRIDKVQTCECLKGFTPESPEEWDTDNTSGGCIRRTPLDCQNKGAFVKVAGVKLPHLIDFHVIQGVSLGECKEFCLNNCSCTAYAYSNLNRNSGCLMWFGNLIDIRELMSETHKEDIYIRMNSSELVSSSKWKLWLIVPIAISVTLAGVIWGIWRRLQRKGEDLLLFDFSNSSEDTKYALGEANRLWRAEKKEVDLPLFSFTSVSAATNNFSIENKLGEGGFGPVYKGKSQKGYEVAVKRLSKRSGQGWEELKNEAMLIAKLQHKNLVKLLGCCIDQDEKILIYEYMPNKSLDFFLFDPANHGILYWETRVHIIEGIAQGLLYLHQYSRLRIIHRDLKAGNILLDEDMNPKISDFGMARIFGDIESKATNHIVGTYGYMSPEYALEGLFSTKSDVFSFGVLLLEILSGKKNTGFYQSDSLNLLGYAWDLWKEGRGQELMDPVLEEETVPRHILLRYINVGLLCVQESADDRPSMSDIVSMLGNESVCLPSPKQPAFSNLRSGVESHRAQNRPEIYSLNGVTLSIMEAR